MVRDMETSSNKMMGCLVQSPPGTGYMEHGLCGNHTVLSVGETEINRTKSLTSQTLEKGRHEAITPNSEAV